MELNHQIRFCRPFPFRFGFRAIFHNIDRVLLAAILLVPFHKVPPPKESMKESVEYRA